MVVTQEVTLRDYLSIVFRRKMVVITVFITVMLAVIIGLQFFTATYEARVKMIIVSEKTVESSYSQQLMGYQSVQAATTQAEVVKSDAVLLRAVAALKLYERPADYEKQFCSPIKAPFVDLKVKLFDMLNHLLNPEFYKMTPEQQIATKIREIAADLKLNMRVEPVLNTNVFNLIVPDFSPVGSAITANTISRSYIIFDLEQQLAEAQLKYGEKHPMTLQLRDNIKKMVDNLNGYPLIDNVEAVGPASVKVIEQAAPPLEPTFSIVWVILTIGLSFFVAIFLGIVLAFVFEYMDQTFKSSRDIEGLLDLPFLGSIPRLTKKSKEKVLIADVNKVTPYTQSYQNLSDQIYLLLSDKKQKSILMASALKSDNPENIIANLGIYLSNKAGHKVLIIDANLREPLMHELFVMPNEAGLAEVLEGKVSLEKAIKEKYPKLDILTAGKTMLNPLTLLGSTKISELMKAVKEKYEIVLVNCVNLRSSMDAVVLSPFVDAVALIIKEGKTSRHIVKYAISPLKEKNVNLTGAILNDRTFPIPEKIYKNT